jgi:tRNA-dihydrouridine synthase B
MAEAARFNVDNGADVIDINMGCPAKKVFKKAAGSALLADESLVAAILSAVVSAVAVPVTLKIRTGVTPTQRNALSIAKIAEDSGIQMLAVHGRTRADKYSTAAEYDGIAEICQQLAIPVLANGDVDGPEKAAEVLRLTGAEGVMIGRAARGNPWIFRDTTHYLATGKRLDSVAWEERHALLLKHLQRLYAFYGEAKGLRIARKHIAWYLMGNTKALDGLQEINRQTTAQQQWDSVAALQP